MEIPADLKVIAASAKQGGGKSTLALEIERLSAEAFDFCHTMKFADPIYELHDIILNKMEQWTGIPRVKKDGDLLQYLGTEFGRKKYGDNVWVDILLSRIANRDFGTFDKAGYKEGKKFKTENRTGMGLLMIDDLRFENEFDCLGKDVLRVRLECPEAERKLRAESWRDKTTHPSEVGLDGYALSGFFDKYFNTASDGKKPTVIAQEILAEVTRK